MDALLANLCEEKGVTPLADAPAGVEVTRRSKDGSSFLFLLNHNAEEATVKVGPEYTQDLLTGQAVSGVITLAGRGVSILSN
ncbi:Beta-galactosidase C-terminal domain [Paenibacillus cisolokensis]|uniref:Beta-galactosidase C-terminal domain n=1 Tax=Paenibacillus cisolokensis TaxID=1658519 RepID=UPI001FD01B2B|nr:Beta-galactosidase C-terminal domain [Paenibacillus cisolokensis]